jgi:hypothetical protein
MKLKHLATQPWLWAKKHWLISALALLVGACAFSLRDRTVSWEEEVPLNTGETIWVKRSMPWVYKGGMGNPFDMDFRASGKQTIRFTYAGKEYSYTGINKVLWVAISPQRFPVLVADPSFNGWNFQYESAYYCVIPYYVQFNSDSTGTKWTWPEKIDPWLYNLPANLMVVIPNLNEARQSQYTIAQRDERDRKYRRQTPSLTQIDPLYKSDSGCPEKQSLTVKPEGNKK